VAKSRETLGPSIPVWNFLTIHRSSDICGLSPFPDWAYALAMEKDQLRELFCMQKSLNERIGVQTESMTQEQKAEWVLNYSRAMSQEIAELTDSVPWKWWAKYQVLDEQNARVEVVDLFHFLISLAQVLGMSADDVFQAYIKKNEVNLKRQESGYTEKDHSDSRHI
jgi:dimeric dUTPase (all-alpha-NTP-PPase superfamily)